VVTGVQTCALPICCEIYQEDRMVEKDCWHWDGQDPI
jgi:hypothetical protein